MSDQFAEEPECPELDEVERRLRGLQIPRLALQESLRRAHLAGDFCTVAHARTYRGLRVYHETNGELRTYFATLGWYLDDDDNIPRIIRPDGLVVLTAVSGNSFTGLRVPGVQTRHPRGEAGIRLVHQNAQTAFIEMLPENDPERVGGVEMSRTWFLLYFREGDIVRGELSLADGVTEDGNLLLWSERLILPDSTFTTMATAARALALLRRPTWTCQ